MSFHLYLHFYHSFYCAFVVVVRRRRRPSSPSCKSKAACKFSQKMQNMSPTATGLVNSESTNKIVQIPWFKSKKGIGKVCFMSALLLHKNFGPNVHVNLLIE